MLPACLCLGLLLAPAPADTVTIRVPVGRDSLALHLFGLHRLAEGPHAGHLALTARFERPAPPHAILPVLRGLHLAVEGSGALLAVVSHAESEVSYRLTFERPPPGRLGAAAVYWVVGGSARRQGTLHPPAP